MANSIDERIRDLCCRLYGFALTGFPPQARASYAPEAQVVAADYLADALASEGRVGLFRAGVVLTRDALVSGIVEWCKVPQLLPVLGASLAITLSNFYFGNDLAGTCYWALVLAASAIFLGLRFRSASFALMTLLVLLDTSAGALSVFTAHRTFEPVFVDTLQWVPLAIVLIAAGSYSGARLGRVLVKHP